MTSAHEHQIEIKPNSKPVRLNFYRTSPQAFKEFENQVSDILKQTSFNLQIQNDIRQLL